MKKLLLLPLLATLFACGSKEDTKISQIHKLVKANAMGTDVNYKPIDIKLVDSLMFSDFYDYVVVHHLEANNESIAENIERVTYITNSLKEDNDVEAYHLWNFNLKNLDEYKKVEDKNRTAVRLFEHRYSIVNPMLDKATVEVTNYYLFTPTDSLLGYISDWDYKEYKREMIQHPKGAVYRAYYEATQ